MLFNISIGDVVSGIGCTLRKFADNTRLCGADNALEERDAIQRDFDRLERIECSHAERPGVPDEWKLHMSQQCALTAQTANCTLGCIQSSTASRSGRCCCPSALCCEASPGALPAGVESSVQERHGAVGEHPEEGHKNDARDGTTLL